MPLSILAGPEMTANLGETPPGWVLSLEAANRRGAIGADLGTMDKYTGKGWRGRLNADAQLGPAFLGAGYSHRDGGGWAKDTPWARAGLRKDEWMLLVEQALGSPNKETRAEVKLRGKVGPVSVEPSAFVQRYYDTTANPQPHFGGGAALKVGFGR